MEKPLGKYRYENLHREKDVIVDTVTWFSQRIDWYGIISVMTSTCNRLEHEHMPHDISCSRRLQVLAITEIIQVNKNYH